MKSCAKILLQTDSRLRSIPHGNSLVEYVIRSTSDLLIDAASITDFCSKMEMDLAPFQSELGPLKVEIVDDQGHPANEHDDPLFISISMTSKLH